jgi:hypothetical protein
VKWFWETDIHFSISLVVFTGSAATRKAKALARDKKQAAHRGQRNNAGFRHGVWRKLDIVYFGISIVENSKIQLPLYPCKSRYICFINSVTRITTNGTVRDDRIVKSYLHVIRYPAQRGISPKYHGLVGRRNRSCLSYPCCNSGLCSKCSLEQHKELALDRLIDRAWSLQRNRRVAKSFIIIKNGLLRSATNISCPSWYGVNTWNGSLRIPGNSSGFKIQIVESALSIH